MNIDPVSGNEIPLGSEAENVRDDVDAKLSEGEYVVPADVVKFFGVQHFEKLIQKAKGGMEEMQANGRGGGEPVEPTIDEDLASIDGYAAGGLVEGSNIDDIITRVKAAAMKDPSVVNMLQAKGIHIQGDVKGTPPSIEGKSEPRQFADGGYVSEFDPYAHKMGFSAGQGEPTSTPTTTAAGVSAPVCPEGYVWDPELNICSPSADAATTAETASSTSSRRSSAPVTPVAQSNPDAWMEEYNYGDPQALFQQSMAAIGSGNQETDEEGGFLSDMFGGVGSMLAGGIAGGVLGKFMNTTNSARVMANAEILDSLKLHDLATQLRAQNDIYVEQNGLSLVPETWRDGDQIAARIQAVKGDVIGANPTPTTTGVVSSSSPSSVASGTTATSTPTTTGSSSDTRSDARAAATDEASRATEATANATTPPSTVNSVSDSTSASRAAAMTAVRGSVPNDVAAGLSGSQIKAGTDVGANEDGSDYVGAFNKGGLVGKPNRKPKAKPKAKSLVNKRK